MSKEIVLGLDLSLTASAIVVLPTRWQPGTWSLRTFVIKTKHVPSTMPSHYIRRHQMERLDSISRFLLDAAKKTNATHVFVEDYAFAAKQTSGRAVAELGGVVKHAFWQEGLDVIPMNMASARKTLLGHVPAKRTSGIAVKDYVNHALSKMGARFESMDEGDAFVVANAGRAQLGLSHVGVSE